MQKFFKDIYSEYPPKFWALIGVYFIVRIDGALIFPFLSLSDTFSEKTGRG